MTVDEAFEHIRTAKPKVVFVNGKTATGKTTFAKKLKSELDYMLIEMDEVARQQVITPLRLPDTGETFVEIYQLRNHPEWISLLINSLQKRVHTEINNGHPVVLEGALKSIETMKELFVGLPNSELLFFYPKNLQTYEYYVTQRFLQANESYNALLPQTFWRMVDDADFKKFCQTRELSPGIKKSINKYCENGLRRSDERLAEVKENFDDVLVVEI